MRITTISVGRFPMPFRFVFRHSSAARTATENVIVSIETEAGLTGWGEGCPRSYVTGETMHTARTFLTEIADEFATSVVDIESLRAWIDTHVSEIDDNPAAFCGLELAALDALARTQGAAVEELLGRQHLAGSFRYSAVLGDAGRRAFGMQMLRYRFGGIQDFKLKLSGDLARDRRKLGWFRRSRRPLRVRVDANNLWASADACIEHLTALEFPLFAVEEPLHADDLEGFAAIADALDTRIVLDESLLRREQITGLPGRASRWLLNCRVSKMGGVIRSIEIAEAATAHDIDVIVGAHVGETSLLTRAALSVAAATRPRIVAQEGAFGTYLLEEDLCDPCLMFGRGGVLSADDQPWARAPGWGLTIRDERVVDRSPRS